MWKDSLKLALPLLTACSAPMYFPSVSVRTLLAYGVLTLKVTLSPKPGLTLDLFLVKLMGLVVLSRH